MILQRFLTVCVSLSTTSRNGSACVEGIEQRSVDDSGCMVSEAENKYSIRIIRRKLFRCVAVRASVRNRLSHESVLAEYGTPGGIAVHDVAHLKSVDCYFDKSRVPVNIECFCHGPDRTVLDIPSGRVRVVLNKPTFILLCSLCIDYMSFSMV